MPSLLASKEVLRQRCRDWYAANRSYAIADKKRRNKCGRRILTELKDRPCMDCGNRYPSVCMDFDHVRGVKCAPLSVMVCYNLDRIVEETDKCDVVCSNCHRIRTFRRKLKERSGGGIQSFEFDILACAS